MQPHNIIFDLDGTVVEAISYGAEEEIQTIKNSLGAEFLAPLTLESLGYPHLVFPGFYALFRWIHSQGGNIHFFSSAVEERNVDLVPKLMRMAFEEKAEEVLSGVKIFSRQHCINTEAYPAREEPREKYQGLFYGNKKKKLEDVVVTRDELPWTLLVEDDSSYMTAGEETHIVKVASNFCYWSGSRDESEFLSLHKAFYLCGLLKKIYSFVEAEEMTLNSAAKHVQVDLEGWQLKQNFYYWTVHKMEYYRDGLATLQSIDPELAFCFENNRTENRMLPPFQNPGIDPCS